MDASCDQTALGAFWTAIAREQSFDQLDGKEYQKVKRCHRQWSTGDLSRTGLSFPVRSWIQARFAVG